MRSEGVFLRKVFVGWDEVVCAVLRGDRKGDGYKNQTPGFFRRRAECPAFQLTAAMSFSTLTRFNTRLRL